jgi:hypothetical protein
MSVYSGLLVFQLCLILIYKTYLHFDKKKNTWFKSHVVRVTIHFLFVDFGLEFSHLNEGVV